MACVETALGPPKLIPGGRYTPDFAAEVAGEKDDQHAPLERQAREMGWQGLQITSSTLWDQIEAAAKHLAPVHQRLHAYILARPFIHMDETHWKFLGSNGGEHEQKRGTANHPVLLSAYAGFYCSQRTRPKPRGSS